jgi:hypothetical protein
VALFYSGQDPGTNLLIAHSRLPRVRYRVQAINTGLRIPDRPQSRGLICHASSLGDLNRGMAIVPPQHQRGPVKPVRHPLIYPALDDSLATLINGQNTTLSRQEQTISCAQHQQDATRLRNTSRSSVYHRGPVHFGIPRDFFICRWINKWNGDPKPFVWTKAADEILTASPLAINELTAQGANPRALGPVPAY